MNHFCLNDLIWLERRCSEQSSDEEDLRAERRNWKGIDFCWICGVCNNCFRVTHTKDIVQCSQCKTDFKLLGSSYYIPTVYKAHYGASLEGPLVRSKYGAKIVNLIDFEFKDRLQVLWEEEPIKVHHEVNCDPDIVQAIMFSAKDSPNPNLQ